MRICSIINSLTTGGAEVLVCALTEEFARLGDKPLVVALCDSQTLGNSVETEDRMIRDIKAAGGSFRSLGLNARRNPATGSFWLKRALYDFSIEVVHAHTVRALPMLALSQCGVPRVLTHHNTRLPFPPWMFKLFDHWTDRYVAIGSDVEEILLRHAGKPVVRIPNAANRSFKTGEARRTPSDGVRVLSVGAISAQKNYPLVIEAAVAVKSLVWPGMTPRFQVAGGGADLAQMRELARSRGVSEMVEFLGERSDVPDLMTGSDVYLNVSLFEGMPLTLLEAMASGLPIVATDVPGNRELVEDGRNGLRIMLGDGGGIAQSLKRLVTEPELYRRLSVGSIEKSRDFTIEQTASRHRDLYRSLVNGRPSPIDRHQRG
ncbi:glycosyltransferase family 4 protein [Parerythrobacter aurantius]|uniref:glycosyltransferase family 4 protein n=1 Tax=Parerythrobacter aurantius TaxID=3127706 RepID=UPI00324EEB7B